MTGAGPILLFEQLAHGEGGDVCFVPFVPVPQDIRLSRGGWCKFQAGIWALRHLHRLERRMIDDQLYCLENPGWAVSSRREG